MNLLQAKKSFRSLQQPFCLFPSVTLSSTSLMSVYRSTAAVTDHCRTAKIIVLNGKEPPALSSTTVPEDRNMSATNKIALN